MEYVFVIALYLLPTIVAAIRGHASKWAIVFVNIFFGWTVIIWVYALVWALANKGGNQTVIINNHNGK